MIRFTAMAGRKRSETSRKAILASTLALLRSRGYSALTIDAIAADAHVGKHTIYRWWATKADVVLEAMIEMAAALIREPDTGSLAGDLRRFMLASVRVAERQDGIGLVLTTLMAEAQRDREFRDRFRPFIDARRAALGRIFRRAAARGELRAGADVELVVDMVFGALWYRLLVGHASIDRAFATSIAELAAAAAGA